VSGGKVYKLNLLPSGIIHEHSANVIGNGVVVDLVHLTKELDSIEANGVNTEGRLLISDRAHVLFAFHQIIDGLSEKSLGKDSIGTTKKGIGPCYATKADRINLRVGDLRYWKHFEENLRNLIARLQKRYGFEYDVEAEVQKYKQIRERILPMITDTVQYVNKAFKSGKKILIEGANAVMLDIDFGTYPFVTSSSPSIGGACTGLGIPPSRIQKVVGVIKAYCTRVGGGPFPTELDNELGEFLRKVGHEFGTTTGRERRTGWIDIPAINYANDINGFTSYCLTKLDVLTGLDEIKVGAGYKYKDTMLESMPAALEILSNVEVQYESHPGWKEDISKCKKFSELPENARKYVKRLEQLLQVPIEWIGVGADRDATIHCPNGVANL
jgi:adenylosuccinate synthase